MIILALDQSTSHTGYCVIVDGALGDMGVINVPDSLDLNMRTVAMCHDVEKLIQKYHPDYLVLEEIFALPGRYNAIKALAILRGALVYLWWLRSLSCPIVLHCNTARVQLGIKGNAQKLDVMNAVNSKFNLNVTNEHVSDAVVLAVVASAMLTSGKTELAKPEKVARKKKFRKNSKSNKKYGYNYDKDYSKTSKRSKKMRAK